MSAITDVRGVRVGHWTDTRALTGCTVVLFDAVTGGGRDVRGGAPGTYETDILDPLTRQVGPHAVLLTGGSLFGLAAAIGVTRWLEENGIGVRFAGVTLPLVVAAVIFDLRTGDPTVRPDDLAGYAACAAATAAPPAQGAVGVGIGASVGKRDGRQRQGGVGTASARVGDATVGALFAVNAVGDVVDERGDVIASRIQAERGALAAFESTTIGVIATDAPLSKVQANILARAGHDGIARAVVPAHTTNDGDTTFAVATGLGGEADLDALIAAAADVSAAAIRGAIRNL
ncbi:MAG TPA: P1 family peptidase [Candidatus Limnocylindria bacterium]|nr:P1 family peptidase [Candidatus Limnocylindria bacterium]